MRRYRFSLFVVTFFGICIALGAWLGNGESVIRDRHTIAFAVLDSCPSFGECSFLYVVPTDSLEVDAPPPARELPPTARRIVESSDRIVSLDWSADGARIWYLTATLVYDPEAGGSHVTRADVWSTDLAGSSRRVATGVLDSDALPNFYRFEIEGAIDGYVLHSERPASTGAGLYHESHHQISPDGTRTAFLGAGIDSTWVCVRPSDAPDMRDRTGCFGDGFFVEPRWRPAGN